MVALGQLINGWNAASGPSKDALRAMCRLKGWDLCSKPPLAFRLLTATQLESAGIIDEDDQDVILRKAGRSPPSS